VTPLKTTPERPTLGQQWREIQEAPERGDPDNYTQRGERRVREMTAGKPTIEERQKPCQ
jgi:hypothetical protein